MAIQQNSTLIYDNVDECPSLLKEPEELSRYSPILPLGGRSKQMDTIKETKSDPCNNNNKNENLIEHKQFQNLHKYQKYTRNARPHPHPPQRNYAASSCSGQSSRSRTVSLSGVNSTEQQGHKEIPIWLGNEPRYVSGVNSRTTCNEIIKALIDDEIRNGGDNQGYFAIISNKSSRDCNDYVITESWRGIERSYDGNMAILPVWKAWSRVHNEIRLSLKHHNDVVEPPPPTKKRDTWLRCIRKYFAKLFKFPKRNNKMPVPAPNNHQQQQQQPRLLSITEESPAGSDEIVFILSPDKKYDHAARKLTKINELLEPTTHNTNTNECSNTKAEMLRRKLYSLSETRKTTLPRKKSGRRKRPKRKLNTQPKNVYSFTQLCKSPQPTQSPPANETNEVNNCIRRRKDAPLRNSIRHKLVQKTNEIDTLYKRENELTRRLNHKCQLYKLHNELYAKADQRLEISIGQIQRSVEQYAEEIIQTEHELLELKNEIEKDISMVNNLKRMSTAAAENGVYNCGVLLKCELEQIGEVMNTAQKRKAVSSNVEMQFVDNIYEFCDNNASMLV